jgi:hypothetical protein
VRRPVRQLLLCRRRTSRLELELHLVDVIVVVSSTSLPIELEGARRPVDIEEDVGRLRLRICNWRDQPPDVARLVLDSSASTF